jgi:hypothetical protein
VAVKPVGGRCHWVAKVATGPAQSV